MPARSQPAPAQRPRRAPASASAPRTPAAPFSAARASAQAPLQAADLLALQRSVGNRATARLLAQRRPTAGAPVLQRVIVRVGYDAQKMQSWNKFVKAPHHAVKAKVDLLEQASPQDRIADYSNDQLVTVKQGNIGATLHVVGHGKPGVIAGVDASTLAENIRISLGNDANNITDVKLHSCFSNILDSNNKTSGGKFSEKFANANVAAASGIHFADTATNLPPRYTGFKFAASIAKQKLLADHAALISDASNNAQERGRINNVFDLLNNATRPLEEFAKKNCAIYTGLDPSEDKTQYNKAMAKKWQDRRVDLDAMPRTTYPAQLNSIVEGLKDTYNKITSDIDLMRVANPDKQEQIDNLQKQLNKAYEDSVQNYQGLETAVDMLAMPFALQDND